jgi:RNA polymerase sigma-70 factor (ECF subfamily)
MATDPTLAELFQAQRQGLAGTVRSVLGASADVAEVLQDSFLRCWRSWQRGDRPADLVAWVFVVTWNVAVDQRRRRQRRPEPAALDEETIVHPTAATGPVRALEHQEDLQRAQRAIERLADPEKQVFLLRVAGGLSFAAVAEALAIPEGTAKTRMRAALQRLRWALGVPSSGEAISKNHETRS